jgi:hypothetical protein
MRIRTRLQRLERRADTERGCGDSAVVEIWLPDNGRAGPPPGRYPCAGSEAVLVIYDPTDKPSAVDEA